ncbi:NRDE family protein [Vibrio rumoiensis]|uniref:NRDE family protein n=1 Tax=Vibrio rumoiensis 1S-45 TaxID=1188252 RepID=A0A1E5E6A1_9VIBR|nr:NRDE family protein [Vibrio rumoiensis]OEF30027.1 hypothetical protein A1QC_03290 [Vibrio rumoiensis 1S-45]
MCTVTWRITSGGYQVLFNRDEQRSRSIALPPNAFTQEGCTAFMPIDPDGQGSWIACNTAGLSLCLLNYYQGSKPASATQSRGQLIRQLAHCQSKEDVLSHLEHLNWQQFPPFTLVIFDPKQLTTSAKPPSIIWDGITVQHVEQTSPITSSSYEFESVSSARQSHFQQLGSNKPSLFQLLAYQMSHDPQKGSHSVCMHRDDAHTVSLTIINVEEGTVSMDYHQGSPCLSNMMTTISQSRKSIPKIT